MSAEEQALAAVKSWYSDILERLRDEATRRAERRTTGRSRGQATGIQVSTQVAAPKGTIGAALIILERLRFNFDLDIATHLTAHGSQISGVSGPAIKKILARFGEQRPFLSEGGRTNRGAPRAMEDLLVALAQSGFAELPEDERNNAITAIQKFMVDRVRELPSEPDHKFPGQKRLKMVFNRSHSSWQTVRDILLMAEEQKKAGPVAQHLVGAKLQLRFPKTAVGNQSFSTADVQLGRPGDFHLGDTAIHVTVAPMQALFEKCKGNIDKGYRVLVLVPADMVYGARQNAALTAPGQIVVEAVESFISQNLEELSEFESGQLRHGVVRLLEIYNQRVDAVELDKSLMIEIPQNLPRSGS